MKSRLTLIELVVTILILVGLSSVLIPLFGDASEKSRKDVAKVSFQNLRDIIMGTPQTPGYFQDIGFLPARLKDLYIRPLDENPED
ncbi:MAG: type II secretion system protein, partial [Planctomycetota bacterium]|nr:type II secretion system protein [Planctomycetota bacterium]